MPLGPDYTTATLRRETLLKLKKEADARGMKIYALADCMIDYFMTTNPIRS